MAELDNKLLQNLDDTLKTMNKTLSDLSERVKSIGTSWQSASKSADDFVKQLRAIASAQNEIKTTNLSESLGIDTAKTKLSELAKYIMKLKGDIDSGTEGSVKWNSKSGKWKYSKGNQELSGEEQIRRQMTLNQLEEIYRNLKKGSAQVAIELANINAKEKAAEQKALLKSIELYNQYAEKYKEFGLIIKQETKKDGTLTARGAELREEQKKIFALARAEADEIRKARLDGVRLSQEEELRLELEHQTKLRKIRERIDKQGAERAGTKGAQERAIQERNTRKVMKEINDLIEARNMKEANLSKEGKTDKYYEQQKKKIEEINQKIEEQKRLLGSYGKAGERALTQLGKTESNKQFKEDIKDADEAFRKRAEIERAWNEKEIKETQQREKLKTEAERSAEAERLANAEADAKKRAQMAEMWRKQEEKEAKERAKEPTVTDISGKKGLTSVSSEIKKAEKDATDAAERRAKATQRQLEIQNQLIAKTRQIAKEEAAINVEKRKSKSENRAPDIAKEQAAIKALKDEMRGLAKEAGDINKEYKGTLKTARELTQSKWAYTHAENARMLKNSLKDIRKEASNLLPTLQRLASAFGIAFSVRGLAQFGKKLIETRGEFERQQVALRSILQNKQLADEIWDKTMQAALQSPFTAMQLTTYTKQLAAYRIETDKLFETTKRLADVSAGLGVDMQRLILAYGQVKAANYLRASEIRQFTEAGVNVLGELRDYFNDVKGMSVDTAKVMEMVTKRLVTFEDVEAIFKRMTDQGGIFYDMQYVQSQTVRGQIAKLHDAYDQMLNSIGQANEGALKNMVSLLNSIVKNWQEFKTVIDLIAWPLLISFVYKFSRGLMTTATASRLASVEMSKVVIAGAKTKEMFTKLFATIATHPFIALGAAVAAVGVALLNHAKHVRDINKRYEDLMLRTYETQKNFDGLSETIQNNLDTMKKATKGSEAYNEASRENENIVKKLKDQYPELLQDIDLQKDGYEKLIEKIKQYNDELENQIRLEYAARASLGQDDLTTNIADLQETQRERQMQFLRNREKAEKKYLELKAQGKEAEEDEFDARMRNAKTWQEQNRILIDLYSKKFNIRDYERPIGFSALLGRDVGSRMLDLEENIENEALVFNDIIRNQLKTINEDLGDDIQQFITDNETQINELFKDKEGAGWKLLNKQITKFFTAKGATDKETREAIQNFLNKYLLVPIQLDWGGSETTETATKEFSDWQKRVNEAIDKASSDFNKKRAELSEDAKKNMPEIEVYKIKDPLQTLEDAQSEILKKLKEVRAKIASYEVKGQVAIDNAEYQALKLTEQEMEQVRVLLGAVAKVTGGGGHKENASKLISLIKEMRGEYDKLSKSAYGYAKSEEKVRDAYKDSVKEILGKAGITDYDFTTNEGMIKALEKVKSYATKLGKDAAAEVQKYIDQLETEIEINAQVRIREDFGKQMEKAFNDYELTLELDKLNISPDAAKNLFPEFDSQTLGELQDAMQEFYQKQGASFDEEDLKVYKQWSDKIDAEILKSRKEKAKQYSKYLEKEYSERAKVEMQYAKDVAFVTANFNGEQQKNILKGIEDKYQKDINELTWKSFKESAFYVEMMDDLSSVPADYMKIMLDKIEELLAHPETLSPRALKEAINARQKILEAQMDINSISVMRESLKEMRDAATDVGGKTWAQTKKRLDEEQTAQAEKLKGLEEEIRCYEELQGQLKGLEQHDEAVATANRALPEDVISMLENTDIDTLIGQYSDELDSLSVSEDAATSAEKDTNAEIQARIEYLQRIIPLLESYRTALNERAAYQATDAGENALFARNGGETSSSVGETINEYKKESDDVSNRLSVLKKWQKAFKNFSDGMAKWNGAVADAITKIGAMGDAFYDTFDALGGETNVLTEGWKEFGDTMVQTITQALTLIPQLVAGFIAAGTSINAAMGLIGLIAEAVQLILVAVGAVAKLHDARYEREIEIQQKKMDDLQRAYDRLEKSIEKAFDTVSYIREYNQEVQNLNEQYEALAKQIDAEKAKKNVDEDKLQDYADKQQEIIDNLEEIKQQQIDAFGGIGEDNYRSAAEGFVDAWKSAFLETGDGLQGLQDHFDEFLNDWFVKQATMRYASAALEPVFKMIDDAVSPNGAGGANVVMQELEAIKEWARVNFPQISDTLEDISRPFIGEGEGSLSGLAAGIQGMTEEQANILEAYWNSVRGYTANIDMNVSRIAQILGSGGDSTNPQLQQLTLIAANTQATHQLLQSVTKSGHSQGGYGIKVFAD